MFTPSTDILPLYFGQGGIIDADEEIVTQRLNGLIQHISGSLCVLFLFCTFLYLVPRYLPGAL